MDYSKIRGFNYQPSYASTSFESWMFFDPQIWELEFRRGKDYFPGINALRLWLDWAAYIRNPERFVQNFATAVELCDRICGAKALPCCLTAGMMIFWIAAVSIWNILCPDGHG